MELNKVEVNAVQTAIDNVEWKIREISELELALVGGGMGDVSLG